VIADGQLWAKQHCIEPLYMQGPNPTEPASKLTHYYHPPSLRYTLSGLQSVIKGKNEEEREIKKQSPVYLFMYALKSSEARRQYPKRLKMLFDFSSFAWISRRAG
jgi:hypothetical protein